MLSNPGYPMLDTQLQAKTLAILAFYQKVRIMAPSESERTSHPVTITTGAAFCAIIVAWLYTRDTRRALLPISWK